MRGRPSLHKTPIKFLADEDFHPLFVMALRRRVQTIDIVRVVDKGLSSEPDSRVLEWAATADRVLLTHDLRTMPNEAMKRVSKGEKMPGVLLIPQDAVYNRVLDDLVVIALLATHEELEGTIQYLPL